MRRYLLFSLFLFLGIALFHNNALGQVQGLTRTGQQGTISETLHFIDQSGKDVWIYPRLSRAGEKLYYKPVVSTDSSNSIQATTATVYGNVWHHGWLALSDQGIQIRKGDANFADESNNVNISVSLTLDACADYATGNPFHSDLTGLDPNTTYYYRTFATNEKGTSYGDTKSFKTLVGITLVSNTPDTVLCNGSTKEVQFTARELVHIAGTTYTWSVNPTGPTTTVIDDTIYKVTFTPTSTTTYTIGCTSSLGGSDSYNITFTIHELPTVSFVGSNNDQGVCLNVPITNITLTNSYSTLSASGLPDGVTLSGTTISGTPTDTTKSLFSYTITATSDQTPSCGTDSVTGTITVHSLPPVEVLSGSETSASICAGASATLTASGADSYQWALADGLSGTTGATVNATPSTTTKYFVTGTENTHHCTAVDSIVVNVNALPNTALSQSTYSVCSNSTVELSATGADTYTWSVEEGTLSATTGTPVTYTPPTTPGNYAVTVTGKNAANCEKQATGTITVYGLPTVTISGDAYVCDGSSITLTASGATSYTWSASATGATLSVSETGSYTVEGEDANGCKVTSAAHSVTKESPAVTITSALANTSICKGSSTTLTASTSDVVGNLSYRWNTTPEQTTETTTALSPTVTTDYTVTVTATSPNLSTCYVTANKTVTVTVLDPDNYTVEAITGTNTICAGNTTTLTANPSTTETGYTYSYQWKKGGTNIEGATAATYTTPVLRSNAIYTVDVTATISSCVSSPKTSADYPVTVNSRPQVTIALAGDTATVSTSEAGLTYQWYKGSTILSGHTSEVLTGCLSNSTYTCVVSNTNCDTSVSVTTPYIPTSITIVPPTEVKFCYAGGAGTQDATYTANLDDPSHNSEFTYNWYYDGALQSSHSNTFTKTYAVGDDASNHTVKVEVVGQTTVNDTYTQTVVIPDPHISAATITGNTAFCDGSNTTLTANATSDNGGAITYQWSNSLGSNAEVTVSTADTYTVTATSTLDGCAVTATASSTIQENDPTDFTVNAITGDNSICKDETTTLTANPTTTQSGYTYVYQWYKDNVAIAGATNATYTTEALADNATYTVKVKAVRTLDGVTCTSSNEITSADFLVTVTQPLSVSTTNSSQTVCAGTEITDIIITHNGTLGTPMNMPSGVSLSGNTISGTPSAAGIYNIKVPVTTSPLASCGKDTANAILTVNALPNAPEVNVDENGNVATITNPQEGVTYTWDNGTTGISTTYASGAAASHTVTATDNTTSCQIVTTFPVHDIASSIALNSDMDIAYCENEVSAAAATKTYTATPTPAGTYTYTWKVDGLTQTSTSNTMNYTFSDATSNTHTIAVSIAGASTSGTTSVTVYALPTIAVATGEATQSVCKGAAISDVTFNVANGTAAIDGTANGLTLSSNVLSGIPTADCSFNVKVTSEHGCTAANQAISVTRKDTAILTVTGDKDRSVCAGETLTINFNTNATWSDSLVPDGMTLSGTTLSGIPTASGSYTVTTSDLNGCGSKSITGVVTVNPLPTLSISTTDNKTAICSGESIMLTADAGMTSYSWSNSSTSNSITVSPAYTTTYTLEFSDGTCSNTISKTITVNQLPTVTISGNSEMCAGASGNTLTANVTPSATYDYQWMKGESDITGATTSTLGITESGSYTVLATNTVTGCSNISSTKTVTVQNPTISSVSISANPGTTICAGSSTTLTATPSGANGTVTYKWSNNSTNSAITVTAGGEYKVTATVKLGNCTSSQVTASQDITVNALPTVTLSPSSQTVCTGTNISTITISPTNATIQSVVGLPAGLSWSDGSNIIVGTPTTADTYTVTATVNSTTGCGTATGNATITVNPAHTLSDLSNATQTVCQNSAIADITFTSANTDVTVAGLPEGVSWIQSDNNYTISGTPSVSGTFNYTVTAASLHSCGDNLTKFGTITVTALPTATISSSTGAFTMCTASAGMTLSVPDQTDASYTWSDGTNSNSNRTWAVSPATTTTYNVTVTKNGCSANNSQIVTVNPLPSCGITGPTGNEVCEGSTTTITASASNCSYLWNTGATTASITPTISANETLFSVIVTDNTTHCQSGGSMTIYMKAKPTISLAAISPATICNGSSTPLTAVPSVNPSASTVTYEWSPASGLSATTTASVTANPTTTTTYTVSATATNDGCSSSASTTATVTVNSPSVTLGTIANQTVCAGSSTTVSPNVTASNGTLSYVWSTGATTPNLSLNPAVAGKYKYTVTVTSTIGSCFVSDSMSMTVSVNPVPTISLTGTSPQSVCAGSAISDITATGLVDGSNVACTWSSGPNAPAGISYDASTKTISGTPTAAGTYTYTLTATISQSPSCGSATQSGTITVKALPDVTAISGTTHFCEGASTELSVTSISGATYLWSNGNTTNAITVTEGRTCYSVTVTGSNGCVKSVTSDTVTMYPNPIITVADLSQMCDGQTATFTATNITPGANVSWSTSGSGCSVTPTTGSNETTLTYPTTDGIHSYTVTGTATTAAGCATSDNGSVTIVKPTAGTLTLTADSTTLCNGSTTTLRASVSGNSGSVTSYAWYDGSTVISGATSDSYVTPTLTGDKTYKCVATITDNGCTTQTAEKSISITVLSPAVNSLSISSNPATPAVCYGNSVTLTAAATGTGSMSYSWDTGDNTTSITKSPTTSTTYEVTATATSSANGVNCVSSISTKQITVAVYNPTLGTVTASSSPDSICPGGSVTLSSSVTSHNGTLSYQWKKNSSDIAGATSATYTFDAEETASYTCEVTSKDGSCDVSATTSAVSVAVRSYNLVVKSNATNATLNLCHEASQILACSAELQDASSNNRPVSGATYTWSAPSTLAAVAGTPGSFTVTDTGTYTITVTASVSGCSDVTNNLTIHVTNTGYTPAVTLCENLKGRGLSVCKVFSKTSATGNYSAVSNYSAYSFIWFKQNESDTVQTGENLMYDSTTTIDFGNYICEVTNPDGCKATRLGTLSLPIAGKRATPAPCTVTSLDTNEFGPNATTLVYVKDHEGNEYSVVQIGDQCWLRENMRCKSLPSRRTMTEKNSVQYIWNNLYYSLTEPYCYATDDHGSFEGVSYTQDEYESYYGITYNWQAAMDTTNSQYIGNSGNSGSVYVNHRGICPAGWHLPTPGEFNQMLYTAGYLKTNLYNAVDALNFNDETIAGTTYSNYNLNVLCSSCDWDSDYHATGAPGNYNALDRNASYFSALPSGDWLNTGNDHHFARFWTAASHPYVTGISSSSDGNKDKTAYVYTFGYNITNGNAAYNYINYANRARCHAYSVRCVRDN